MICKRPSIRAISKLEGLGTRANFSGHKGDGSSRIREQPRASRVAGEQIHINIGNLRVRLAPPCLSLVLELELHSHTTNTDRLNSIHVIRTFQTDLHQLQLSTVEPTRTRSSGTIMPPSRRPSSPPSSSPPHTPQSPAPRESPCSSVLFSPQSRQPALR